MRWAKGFAWRNGWGSLETAASGGEFERFFHEAPPVRVSLVPRRGGGLSAPMKTPIWLMVLLSFAALVAAGAKSGMEGEVTAAINAWRQAMLTHDVAAMNKLLHPDVTYCHSSGITQDKATVLAKVGGSDYFEYFDTTIRIHGNVALVKNVTDMRTAAAKDTPNRLNVLYVWVKGPDGWQMIARQPIKLPNPGDPAPKKK
jgi:ketosteroid isomerase-like protein